MKVNEMNQTDEFDEKNYKNALNKALRWLTYRQRSNKELKDYLSGKGFSYDVIEAVSQRLQDIGLIDDRHFAGEWIEYSFRKGRGSLRIKHELKERGIDETVFGDILEESLSRNNEYARACNIIEKYLSLNYEQDDKRLLKKTASYLRSRGYPHTIIYQIINKYFI